MAPEHRTLPNQQQDQQAAGGGHADVGAIAFADAAERLLDNGYFTLPIRPGTKVPIPKGWSKIVVDEAQVAAWVRAHPTASVGLRTGALIGVDIDLLDPDLAHQAMALTQARLGETLLRVGCWPKRLLTYRTDDAFRKLKIAGFEVLARGQQFVAFGMHPGVGRPYDWPLGESPLDVAFADLPLVTHAQCVDLVSELSQILPTPHEGARRRRGPGGAATAGPVYNADGLVEDGRDAHLSAIAFHAVHDALDGVPPSNMSDLKQLVWDRFRTTTDLRRGRKGGDAPYSSSDAARKVADKLRLARDSQLPPRGTQVEGVVEPPPASSVEAARAQLEALIADACLQIRAWHASEEKGPAPRIGIKATVGLGKSAISRRLLRALREEMHAAGLPSRVVVLTSSHALAEEAAAACRAEGDRAAVWRGYEARHPRLRRPMCADLEAVRAAIQAGVDVHSAACATQNGRRCIHFDGCPKQANRAEVADADVVFAAYDTLFTGFAIQPASVALLLIDEGCWARAVDESDGLCVESLPGDLIDRDAAAARTPEAFGRTADLHELRGRLAAAMSANGPGPLSRRLLRAHGLNADDAGVARSIEKRRFRDPGLFPGMAREALRSATVQAAINQRTLRYLKLWSAVRELLFGEADADGRIAIGDPDQRSGLRPIDVLSTKIVHPNLRDLPMVHLDATLRAELAGTVLPNLQVREVAAEATHMWMKLVAGSFGKTTLVPDRHADAAELRRRANRLAECVDYVRWHAARFKSVLVITYKDVEATFDGIPGVATAHFNAIAGLDAYCDVELLIVIGRPLPRDSDLARLSAAYFGYVPEGGYRPVLRGVRLRDGSARTVRTIGHGDDRAELLRAAICDDELIQAIGRGRGINRTAGNPLEVHLLADAALPIVNDCVTTWQIEAPDIIQQMLLAGLAVDSPEHASRLHPQLLVSPSAAKHQFQCSAFKDGNPIGDIYRETVLKSAAYRLPGKGRGWQRAYWIAGTQGDAKAVLEHAVGRLAEWRPD